MILFWFICDDVALFQTGAANDRMEYCLVGQKLFRIMKTRLMSLLGSIFDFAFVGRK